MRWLFPLLLAASPATADCPPAPDIAAAETALFGQIEAAPNAVDARQFSLGLWDLWMQAPDEAAQELLDGALARGRVGDLLGARLVLTRLVGYCPAYAEGWNQRAFVAYRSYEFEAALADLDRALELNPRHLGALTGKALTLVALGRGPEAVPVLRRALALNPYLSERALLDQLLGEDI